MKDDEKKVLKMRSKSTAMFTMEILKDYSVDDLISEGFVVTSSDIEREIVKRFEGILVKSMLKENYLRENIFKFMSDTARWIKREKIHRELLDFGFFLHNQLRIKNTSINVISSYMNLYIDLLSYLVPVGRLFAGFRTDGTIISIKEIYPPIDLIFQKTSKGGVPAFLKEMRKHGINVKDMDEMNYIIHDEQIITLMVLNMASFIDENTEDMIPVSFYLPSYLFPYVRRHIDTPILKESLKLRRYTLPKEGVYVKVLGVSGIQGILFKEICKNNQIYMLYRLDLTNQTSMYGSYDTKFATFFSCFTESSGDDLYGSIIENLVLEVYSHIVTDMHINDPDGMSTIRDESEHKGNGVISLLMSFNEGKKKPGEERRRVLFDKKKYKEESININPFIRKLPIGSVASEDAIQRALEFGYELQKGETFVRSFTRKTYVSKN